MRKTQTQAEISDEEIDAAIERGKLYDRYAPKAIAAAYRAADDTIVIRLATRVEIAIPRDLLQGLEGASEADLSNIEILGPGSGLSWGALDVDHSVPGLLQGVFGTKKWMAAIGKRGGAATTDAKKKSSRANGLKGGRPKRVAS